MERYAWTGTVVHGMEDEYRKRHDNLWPELKAVLKDAGIRNYSIWMQGNTLFGYYECEKGVEHAAVVQAGSPVVDKWNEYMDGVLILDMDPATGAQPRMTEVFYLE